MQRLIIIAAPRNVAVIADISNRMSVSLNKYTSTNTIINVPTKIQNNIFYLSPPYSTSIGSKPAYVNKNIKSPTHISNDKTYRTSKRSVISLFTKQNTPRKIHVPTTRLTIKHSIVSSLLKHYFGKQ